ncbi:MAG: hypothetical protein WKF35_06215 [Ferruginibacter sp.]
MGMDIAGALFGASTTAILQWSRSRSVEWRSVGQTAVMGAVTSSTGEVGKAAKWINSLF